MSAPSPKSSSLQRQVSTVSTASDDLSDSVCELILGKHLCNLRKARRKKSVYHTPESSFTIVKKGSNELGNLEKATNSKILGSNELLLNTVLNPENSTKILGSNELLLNTVLNPEKSSKILGSNELLLKQVLNSEKSAQTGEPSKLLGSNELLNTVKNTQEKSLQNKKSTSKMQSHLRANGRQSQQNVCPSNQELAQEQEIANHRISEDSNNRGNNKKFNSIETQTVAIQTTITGTNPPSIALVADDEKSNKSSDCSSVQSEYHKCCCKNCWNEYDSEESDNSEESYKTDFFNLPYQNNEEYLELLRELERKLIARNRERVRRTRQKFEKHSMKPHVKHQEPLLSKLTKKEQLPKSCCKCGRPKHRINSDILQNEKKWEDINCLDQNEESSKHVEKPGVERSWHKSHWKLDPRTGEWIKVSSLNQADFRQTSLGSGDEDISKKPRKCRCRQAKQQAYE